jgi:L-amino acid N-acyltransferase YncA
MDLGVVSDKPTTDPSCACRNGGAHPDAMSPIVRDCAPTDIPAIAAIYEHAVLNGLASFELDPPDAAEMARRRADILAKGYPYLVAEQDGAVVGYAYANSYRARPAYRFTVENSVYVAPDRQRGGIGRALLPALITRCEQADYRLMVAVIGDSANMGSIRLHAACGFAHAGLLPAIGWKHGRWVDSVLMTRALGPGANEPPPPGR